MEGGPSVRMHESTSSHNESRSSVIDESMKKQRQSMIKQRQSMIRQRQSNLLARVIDLTTTFEDLNIAQESHQRLDACYERIIKHLRDTHRGQQNGTVRIGSRMSLVSLPSVLQFDGLSTDATKELALKTARFPSQAHTQSYPFELGSNAYFHMLNHGEDQTIIFSGERGTGKSLNYRMTARYISDLARQDGKKSKTASAAAKVEGIFSAFGKSQTDSSSFIRYEEFQFNSNGKLVGIKYIPYLLDPSMLQSNAAHQFQIFHWMLFGGTAKELSEWGFQGSTFSYLEKNIHASHKASTEKDDFKLDFERLRMQLSSVGVGKRQQSQMYRLLAAILHLGNIQFQEGAKDEPCEVKTLSSLKTAADLLSLDIQALESALTSSVRRVGRDTVSEFLTPAGAVRQRDLLARALYSAIFHWLVEHLNCQFCKGESEFKNFIALLDVPGMVVHPRIGDVNNYQSLMVNFTNEKLFDFQAQVLLDGPRRIFSRQDSFNFPDIERNRDQLSLFCDPRSGILPLLNKATALGHGDIRDEDFIESIYRYNEESSTCFMASTIDPVNHFAVIHHGTHRLEYDVTNMTLDNTDALQSSFVTLVRGNPEEPGTGNPFLRSLFSDRMLDTKTHDLDKKTIVAAKTMSRLPALRRRTLDLLSKSDDALLKQLVDQGSDGAMAQRFDADFSKLLLTMRDTQCWFICHVKPSEDSNDVWETMTLSRQLQRMHILEYATNPIMRYSSIQTYEDAMKIFQKAFDFLGMVAGSGRDAMEAWDDIFDLLEIADKEALFGTGVLFLTEEACRSLTALATSLDKAEKSDGLIHLALGEGDDDEEPIFFALNKKGKKDIDAMSVYSAAESNFESELNSADDIPDVPVVPYSTIDKKTPADIERGLMAMAAASGRNSEKSVDFRGAPKKKMTRQRCQWLFFTWFLTWIVPDFLLSICGGMRTKDRRIAWREKVALCIIIFFMNATILFFLVALGPLICSNKNQLSWGSISQRNNLKGGKASVYMYGNYYDIPEIAQAHLDRGLPGPDDKFWNRAVLGQDVSAMFSKEPFWSTYCPSYPVKENGFALFADDLQGVQNRQWWFHHRDNSSTDLIPQLKSYMRGIVVWDRESLKNRITSSGNFLRLFTAYDRVYDITGFYGPQYRQRSNNGNFMGPAIKDIFDSPETLNGEDLTARFQQLRQRDPQLWANAFLCLNGMFSIGYVDQSRSFRCMLPNYILFGASIVLVAVMTVKFLAALQLGTNVKSEIQDKYVICQVTCYTEDEASLKRTFDSLAAADYVDEKRVLFVISDGMIIGSGNDRPTPRIVLDILGVNSDVEVPSFAFRSLGEGSKQLNFAKVYSGLYHHQDRVLPFVVVVKVGKPSERQKPGNRGKRDSQLVLMRFLSRVHDGGPMNPLEIELYRQLKDVIGVQPANYEFLLTIDADTQVYENSLNQLIANMARDTRIVGLCGETRLSNSTATWIAMMQVYEYFISFHMAKAFESIFGSVTCLPGCFTVYRIRSSDGHRALLANDDLVQDYAENDVNTLHMKNLLHLGEDRYLTTLLMKHFPEMKTKFTSAAYCTTYAPETWSILQSQRRRWINSTVHNLFELLMLKNLCGTCCFSMRFVVFVDLLATFIQPSALVYLGWLIYLSISDSTNTVFPLLSLILIGAVYGFQIIIFVMKGEIQFFGWMLLYLIAVPVYSFYLPIYAFWHFDDFSWGNTRVAFQHGKRMTHGPERDFFDPSCIPVKTWAEASGTNEAETVKGSEIGLKRNMSVRSARANNVSTNAIVDTVLNAAEAPPVPSMPPSAFGTLKSSNAAPSFAPSSMGTLPHAPGRGFPLLPGMPTTLVTLDRPQDHITPATEDAPDGTLMWKSQMKKKERLPPVPGAPLISGIERTSSLPTRTSSMGSDVAASGQTTTPPARTSSIPERGSSIPPSTQPKASLTGSPVIAPAAAMTRTGSPSINRTATTSGSRMGYSESSMKRVAYEFLNACDLRQVTKRSVKTHVESVFEFELDANQKRVLYQIIDDFLKDRLGRA